MTKKFYIAVDCEGCACVVGEPAKGLGNGEQYRFACRQATREANAAAKALLDAGAEQVVVWDAHASGVNLEYDLLDPRCHILLGSGHRGRFVGLDNSYTGVLMIGYHARENTADAVLAHTFCSTAFQHYKLNGQQAGELAIDAAYAGELGVPVLFCSGDNVFVQEAKTLLGNIETVTTKTSLSWTSAISRHPAAVCQEIYDSVSRCVNQTAPAAYRLPGPVSVEIRYKRMEDAARALLTDLNGHPFAQPDPFTRTGTVQAVTSLF